MQYLDLQIVVTSLTGRLDVRIVKNRKPFGCRVFRLDLPSVVTGEIGEGRTIYRDFLMEQSGIAILCDPRHHAFDPRDDYVQQTFLLTLLLLLFGIRCRCGVNSVPYCVCIGTVVLINCCPFDRQLRLTVSRDV